MKKTLFLALCAALWAAPAAAQQVHVVADCAVGISPAFTAGSRPNTILIDTSGVLCTSAAGGGGGAATIADGADVATGATTDAAATAGSAGTVNAKLRLMTTQLDTISTNVSSSIPAGTNRIGYTTNDPCDGNTSPSSAVINISTATTTRILSPSASNRHYICYILLQTDAANNVAVIEGTGGTCGTGTAAIMGGTTAGTGLHLSANGGLQAGQGRAWVWRTAGTNVDLCLVTSAATQLTGTVKYVNLP